MSRGKRYKTEEIIKILREVEIYTAKGQPAEQAIRSCGISEHVRRQSILDTLRKKIRCASGSLV